MHTRQQRIRKKAQRNLLGNTINTKLQKDLVQEQLEFKNENLEKQVHDLQKLNSDVIFHSSELEEKATLAECLKVENANLQLLIKYKIHYK